MATDFDYANQTGRPSGPVLRAAARLLPGVGSVHRQVPAYARAWRAANLAALEQPGRRWIVLGDSMSQSIGASRFDAGWVNRVAERLDAAGRPLRLVNLSASGARVPDVLDQQVPAWRALPAAPAALSAPAATDGPSEDADGGLDGPDLITVLIGSNDLMSRTHRDALASGLRQLLDELPPRTVVATLPQPRAAAVAANAVIADAVARRGLIAVDMRTQGPHSWRGKLAEDHFHPNDAGYQGIADAFYPSIAEALST